MELVINTPENLITALIDLYTAARNTRFPSRNVLRGRSHSVSSEFEDLFANYLSNCMNDDHYFYVDQPISIFCPTPKIQYPDILILKDGIASHLLDIKMDNGWNRHGLKDFSNAKNILMDEINGCDFKYNEVLDNTKVPKEAKFSNHVTYHIVFATSVNGSKNLEHDAKQLETKNVKLYILTDKTHPNHYGANRIGIQEKINIRKDEFSRLISNLNN
ncbi:hypothetical protein NLN78_14280 [Citrobacter portucalensis]|uniref:hypothetical protein n=1 Tax=Citrobacter portucalensis TaxID=1639133 RepID=UPI00226AA259|nr:hypothetical protein [Citrobacter portucalensis]MCX8974727.1 hypothetical protein [Citrobacter portucalensis]